MSNGSFMCSRKNLAWLLMITVMLSGCGLLERTKNWKEEVILTNGSSVWLQRSVVIGPDAFFRPGRGSILRSSMSGDIPGIGEVDFEWDSHEVPISFDVINGTPWIVLPIAGPDLCEKYGYPAESVVAFFLKGNDWVSTSFEDAPIGLRNNLLGSEPTDASISIVRASDIVKQPSRKYPTPMGYLLTERFIPQHIEWEHSCPRINPNSSPEQGQSVQEFLSLKLNQPSVKVLSVHDDVIHVDLGVNYFGVLARKDIKDEYIVSDCTGLIGRTESIRPWVRRSDGSMGSGSAMVRIELLREGAPSKNIWLPITKNGESPSLIKCIGSTGYVLINQWGTNPGLVIAQFDLNGSWRNLWRFPYPETHFKQRGIIDFKEVAGGFHVTVGEINHPSMRKAGDPLATIGSRYILEVSN